MKQIEAPKISVVLPVYNGNEYLRQSIESVLSQTFTDFEFIVWDDASTDDSVQILSTYQDARIRVFRNETNKGLFPTLNATIGEANSKWIKLWTQDDILKPHCLQEHWEFLQCYPEIGMCYCAVDTIDETGSVIRPAEEDATPQLVPPNMATRIMFYHGSIAGNISNVTLNKEIFSQIDLFREDMKVSGDFEMWTRICQSHTIGHIAEPLVNLRNHLGQFSRQKSSLLAFMNEDLPIYDSLISRLSSSEKSYAKRYHRMTRHRVYAHFLIRSLLSGDFKTAREIYKILRRISNPLLLVMLWLFTINGRLFRMRPLKE